MINVSSLHAAGPESLPANPCSDNEGDGNNLGTSAEEQALSALGAEVFGHPDVYAGLWRASSQDGLGRIVVAVAGDPSELVSKLKSLYPFPLCVVAVAFTQSDLESTLGKVGASTEDWLADIDYSLNRVKVSVGTKTPEVEAKLSPYEAQIFLNTLVRPL